MATCEAGWCKTADGEGRRREDGRMRVEAGSGTGVRNAGEIMWADSTKAGGTKRMGAERREGDGERRVSQAMRGQSEHALKDGASAAPTRSVTRGTA